jgi:hypothetical protein
MLLVLHAIGDQVTRYFLGSHSPTRDFGPGKAVGFWQVGGAVFFEVYNRIKLKG